MAAGDPWCSLAHGCLHLTWPSPLSEGHLLLDLGPTLTQDNVKVLNVIISVNTLFPNKVTFTGARPTYLLGALNPQASWWMPDLLVFLSPSMMVDRAVTHILNSRPICNRWFLVAPQWELGSTSQSHGHSHNNSVPAFCCRIEFLWCYKCNSSLSYWLEKKYQRSNPTGCHKSIKCWPVHHTNTKFCSMFWIVPKFI